MSAKAIKRYCVVKEDANKLLETAINKLGLSARAYSRVLKVGRTIANLAGAENIEARISLKRFSIGVWIGELIRCRSTGSARSYGAAGGVRLPCSIGLCVFRLL